MKILTFEWFLKLSEYSHLKNEYAYLCPDETLQLISDNSKQPCAWLRQPWPAIISNALVSFSDLFFSNLQNFLFKSKKFSYANF